MERNMNDKNSNPDVIVDYITGASVPHVGAEINRQQVEHYLVEEKGYRREEILVDAPIQVEIDGGLYRSTVDLVVQINGRPLMAVKCAAGSLGSREREIVSAARLFGPSPMPLAVVSDGVTATVLDTASGKTKGKGLEAILDRNEAIELAKSEPLPPIAPERIIREKLVFRSYDSMNVNVRKKEG
jgi:hypothetical protein